MLVTKIGHQHLQSVTNMYMTDPSLTFFISEHIEDIDELQNIINRKQYVLTYFFHPSCYPCMDFVPEFDKIPGRIKDLP